MIVEHPLGRGELRQHLNLQAVEAERGQEHEKLGPKFSTAVCRHHVSLGEFDDYGNHSTHRLERTASERQQSSTIASCALSKHADLIPLFSFVFNQSLPLLDLLDHAITSEGVQEVLTV